MSHSEARAITPLDLPLVRRVIGDRLPCDMCAALARGRPGIEDLLLSSVPLLTDLGAPTLVLRRGEDGYVGQFRHRADRSVAHLTFLAPEPSGGDPRDWVTLLEAVATEAGRRGAHLVNAEVDQNHPVFQAFRLAGFVVYSRQVILRRAPGISPDANPALVRFATELDTVGIGVLQSNTVPRLLQQAEEIQPSPDYRGLVYEQDGQIAGYLAFVEGKNGIVIKPYFHPEAYDQVPAVVLAALAHLPRAEHTPVYLYARAYQDWLRGVLDRVEFETWAYQALMVKFTVVRVGRAQHASLPEFDTSRFSPPVVDGPVPVLRKFMLLRRQRRRRSLTPQWRRNGK